MSEDAMKAAMEHDPKRPGKFEGEHPATVYYYGLAMDGDGESLYYEPEPDTSGLFDEYEPEQYGSRFEITPEERAAFGLAESDEYFDIIWDGGGFVYGRAKTAGDIK